MVVEKSKPLLIIVVVRKYCALVVLLKAPFPTRLRGCLYTLGDPSAYPLTSYCQYVVLFSSFAAAKDFKEAH